MAEVDAAGLRATLAPKQGLDHLADALDLHALRFAVAFGSVIGRTGLAGQSEYAVANEWLVRRCAELAARHPQVRWLTLQWSVWSGTGMGVRLGALDALARRGVAPITVPAGTDALLRVLADPDLADATDLLVTGRLPATPTLHPPGGPAVPGWRFLHRVRAHTPGVEVVADSTITTGDDPYLNDHVIDGVPVLPAVFGLEAMIQSASLARAGAGSDATTPGDAVRLTEVALDRAVTLGADRTRDIRCAALVGDTGDTDLVLRSDETGFAVDHFRARLSAAPPAAPDGTPPPVPGTLMPADAFYDGLFFHGPRFHRVRGYHGLGAYRCAAVVVADRGARWFGAFHDPTLLLGDPGVRDACLHLLQACLPDRRVLPVAVAGIAVHRQPDGPVRVDARQTGQDGDTYVFDLTVTDDQGRCCEQWDGLTLRGLAPITRRTLPHPLVGPHLARRLAARHPGTDMAVLPAGRTDRTVSAELAGWLSGTGGARHGTDGRLVPVTGGATASHLDDWLLVATGPGPIGVDWESADADVPGPEPYTGLVAELGRQRDGAGTAAPVRVWTAVEVLRKLGRAPDAPLQLTGTGPDGEVYLGSGPVTLTSCLLDVPGGVVAVCLGSGS
jgi:enediyne polyketide synthase